MLHPMLMSPKPAGAFTCSDKVMVDPVATDLGKGSNVMPDPGVTDTIMSPMTHCNQSLTTGSFFQKLQTVTELDPDLEDFGSIRYNKPSCI